MLICQNGANKSRENEAFQPNVEKKDYCIHFFHYVLSHVLIRFETLVICIPFSRHPPDIPKAFTGNRNMQYIQNINAAPT